MSKLSISRLDAEILVDAILDDLMLETTLSQAWDELDSDKQDQIRHGWIKILYLYNKHSIKL